MTHYRRAADTPERRQASAVLPGQIIASRAFFAEVEAGVADLAHLPTPIVWVTRKSASVPGSASVWKRFSPSMRL